jgi:hypothetical protein
VGEKKLHGHQGFVERIGFIKPDEPFPDKLTRFKSFSVIRTLRRGGSGSGETGSG